MPALGITLVCFALLILAYFTYGKFLAHKVFGLDPNRRTPAHRFHDGIDYVPTRIPVLFGHHFASIAGLGPILGPALAVIWGWFPAIVWVVLGSIFLGAVHDLGALTVSMRFRGRSIGDVCRELIGPRARLLFLVIIFFAMSLAMGAFVSAITGLFLRHNPDAIIPSFGLMIVAMVVGVAVYRFKVRLLPATVLGLAAFAGLIIWGTHQPVTTYDWFVSGETREALQAARTGAAGEKPALAPPYGANEALAYFKEQGNEEAIADLEAALGTNESMGTAQVTWMVTLLAYGFFASILPVWLLLQPRDYLNSFQLYFALAFLFLGIVAATLMGSSAATIHAQSIRTPGVDFTSGGTATLLFPFLFVTIACGAVSGFHSLVASGTTVRQINRETDALPIGYGGMLTEGALAVLVIMACVAGLGASAWQAGGKYSHWIGSAGALDAVISGGANFLSHLGISAAFGQTLLSVTVVAFAMTTLDSAVRLLRFNVEEIFRSVHANRLANRYFASLVAVGGIAAFCLVPGSRVLWTLFGTTNQMLAGLTLLTVSVFLFKLGRQYVWTLVPMVLMLTVTIWAMILSLIGFWNQGKWPLFGVSIVLLGISLWLIVEAGMSFARGRGDVEWDDEQSTGEEQRELVTASSCNC